VRRADDYYSSKITHETIMHSSISSTSLARIMPREIHADMNAGFTLVKCNREIDEREAQAKEC
jgi:hypothetical protein